MTEQLLCNGVSCVELLIVSVSLASSCNSQLPGITAVQPYSKLAAEQTQIFDVQ